MSQQVSTTIAVMGIDIGKNSFHIVGLDQRGALATYPALAPKHCLDRRRREDLHCPKGCGGSRIIHSSSVSPCTRNTASGRSSTPKPISYAQTNCAPLGSSPDEPSTSRIPHTGLADGGALGSLPGRRFELHHDRRDCPQFDLDPIAPPTTRNRLRPVTAARDTPILIPPFRHYRPRTPR
jgi:hypothetical protein